MVTINFLFWTDSFVKTVQTQIRLHLKEPKLFAIASGALLYDGKTFCFLKLIKEYKVKSSEPTKAWE